MKKFISKLIPVGVATGVVILMLAGVYALSWIITVGLIKLITLCFGWTFDWLTATGIWLVICIARTVFSNHTTVKK